MNNIRNSPKRVLVFPSGTEIALEIHNSFRWSTHFKLFGISSVKSHHGKYVFKNHIPTLIPFVDDPNFLPEIKKVAEKYNIHLIYPAHDSAVVKLAKEQSKLNCKVIGSPYKTASICRSKRKTYEVFQSLLPTPKIYDLSNPNITFPVFLKPDIGEGSKGTYIAHSREEVEFYIRYDPTLLILEFLPGKEYTVDCFTDKDGYLRFVGPRERIRIANGVSVDTKSVPTSRYRQFKNLAQIINKKLKFRGAWFFQLKTNSQGVLTLMEVAPRIAGGAGYHRAKGINLPLLSAFDALDIDIETAANNFDCEMDRAFINRFSTNLYYKHVYVDLDDTIILNNMVNPFLVSFLFQCVNRKIGIYLISKHHKDITNILKRFRIESLFDTVIHLEKDQDKAKFITKRPAIYIDDSFTERQQIAKQCHIPTFDTHAIECLIDWRY